MSVNEHVVVMGVAGTGKTTMAELLAARLGRPFADADNSHPAANIDKMTAGLPLTSVDRGPWFDPRREWMDERAFDGLRTVVACSALHREYRDIPRGVGLFASPSSSWDIASA